MASLEAVGSEKALLLVTGIVRTLTENFSPLTRIRFLVNGREALETTPIDLTVAWALGANP